VSGVRTLVRFSASPLASWNARVSSSPASSPCDPADGWRLTCGQGENESQEREERDRQRLNAMSLDEKIKPDEAEQSQAALVETGKSPRTAKEGYDVVETLEAVAGVEYNADCWAVRLVGQRLTTTTQTTSNSVYLQIELNGLARFGTNPLELLRRSVPGYQQTNDPTVSPRVRDDAFQEY